MKQLPPQEGGSESEYLGFYQKLRRRIRDSVSKNGTESGDQNAWSTLTGLVLLLPDLFHLMVRLLFDKAVPADNKGALVAGIAYVVSPIDIIPDSIPVAGYVDDLIVAAVALNYFIATDDEATSAAVKKYWAGDENFYETVKHILNVADSAVEFLPKKLMRVIKSVIK